MTRTPGLSRRDLLASFLGAPLAAMAGCGSKGAPPLPPGQIVGASHELGHRLRDGFRPQPADNAWSRRKVVIVGGGVAGLSAAWRLSRAGFNNYVLLELETSAGGTACSGKSSVSAFPWGAHYIPAPQENNTWLVTLLDEMGVMESDDAGKRVVGEQFLCRDPQERIFYKGSWFEGLYLRTGASPDDLRQLAAFKQEIGFWVKWRDGRGRPAFAIPMSSASDDAVVKELDKFSMAEFLARKNWHSPRLQWYVEYACRDDYGSTLQNTSAWAGIFYFASRMPAGGEESQPLITWPEGNGRLVNHLMEKIGARVQLGIAVSEVNEIHKDGRDSLDIVAIEKGSNRALGFHADRVIFAAPQFMAGHLIRSYKENPPAHLREFQYGAWMVANLSLKERPSNRGFQPCWDNVIYESPSLGYVEATHQSGIESGPTVFTYYYPLCDDDPRKARQRLLSADWGAWADVALADISSAHKDIRSLVERLDVMRWGHAMIRPAPGFVWGGAREKARSPNRGIHFAHSDLSGIALFEEAFHHGIRAAEEVLQGITV